MNQGSQTILRQTYPYHNSTSAKFDCRHNAFWQKPFSRNMPNSDIATRKDRPLIHHSREPVFTPPRSNFKVPCLS
ncbi:hypothetical protein TNCV_2942661 [Trichonephila clavipes]|nr:hypothetical protein TNCV_2942661 [Trichonephila clavipes]